MVEWEWEWEWDSVVECMGMGQCGRMGMGQCGEMGVGQCGEKGMGQCGGMGMGQSVEWNSQWQHIQDLQLFYHCLLDPS